MSLDKAIAHGKEFRKPYRYAGKIDRSCRPGGTCPWCHRTRTLASWRVKVKAQDELKNDGVQAHQAA